MWYPLMFQPLLMERVWGGRRLAELFGKDIPAGRVVGESWEISDRPGAQSVVSNGPLAGTSLHELMEVHGRGLLGRDVVPGERFPWLCKLLDARADLSLQVHPPAHVAPRLGGEPKTEMWFVCDAEPDAACYAGLREGVTRAEFESRARDGTVAECFHRIPVRAGDVLFVPSGRVHALGAGIVLFEIQQNSDTTYRVFDWNRSGLDGRPRELHLAEAMESIWFDDYTPTLVPREFERRGRLEVRVLVRDPLFHIDHIRAGGPVILGRSPGIPTVLALAHGELRITGGGVEAVLRPGHFCVLPAGLAGESVTAAPGSEFLRVEPGR